MRVAKTVHLLELVRNFDRYKRLILASLISAILIISIIYMRSFLPTAQSGSDGSYKYFEIYIWNVTIYNMTLKGPYIYNTTEGSIEVTNVTILNTSMSEMLLIKKGSRLELEALDAFTTNLMVYTTYFNGTMLFEGGGSAYIEAYGNRTYNIPPLGGYMSDIYMKVVYLEAESFSTSWLSVAYT